MDEKEKKKSPGGSNEDGQATVSVESQEESKKKKKKEEIEELKAALSEKQKELEEKGKAINELKERILYQQADLENFKKLKAKEKQEALRYGNETLIKELLPVIDNLERAIEHASKTESSKTIVEGVELTLNGFRKVLERFGVTIVEALQAKFDPNLHEAVYTEERDDVEPGTVVGEFQKGYIMDGRLLRPSMVSVAKKPDAE
jgi:molecular chaperone GrpE